MAEIVGHALDHDFQVLQLDHPEQMIWDTAVYEPFKVAFKGHTPSLKNLSPKLLGVRVQTGKHSLVQDSQAAARLYMKHLVEWEEARLDGEQGATRNKAVERNFRGTRGKA